MQSTAVLFETLFLVKLPESPMPYSATTTVFGYRKLVDAQKAVENTPVWFRPAMEIWAVNVKQLEATGDERVGMAPGASVLGIELRKRYKAST